MAGKRGEVLDRLPNYLSWYISASLVMRWEVYE